jgi:hypothetical protein
MAVFDFAWQSNIKLHEMRELNEVVEQGMK